MNQYIEIIKTAFFIFPFIAFLITLPYIFVQYNKYGSILLRRVLIVYSFILYLTCIYFLVILPLPSKEAVSELTTPWVQLTPFSFIAEFFLKSSFVFNDFSTYKIALQEPYFYQVFYNILITVPFGIYLRYYFNCSFKKTVLLSFLLSLFFEGTQLSGLYGIYSRPYRLFDIDDLFLNTLGGMIGYMVTPLFSRFLPTREKLDQLSYSKGQKISVLRRAMASGIDTFCILLIMSFFGTRHFLLPYLISVLICFILIPTITKGYTIGKKLMNIKIVSMDEATPKMEQYIVRYGLLYLIFFPLPIYILIYMSIFKSIFFLLFGAIGGFIYLIILFKMFLNIMAKKPCWYELSSQTKNKSTIEVKSC